MSAREDRRNADPGELPRASVVVPVLNAVDEIGRLVESLLALDYPADRIQRIVVDNGSTDGTAERVSPYGGVTLLRETSVRSSYAARNRGIAAASGEWIAFTDADCVADPAWLRRLLAPPVPEETGAVAGEVLALELDTPVQRLTEHYGLMKHAVTLRHKATPCFSTANVAIRRDVLTQLGGFDAGIRFFGDMELSWRMQLELGRTLAFRPEAVIRHRHRRTLAELWRHGRQHGRGVAFMKRRFPRAYSIDPGEQLRRLGGLLTAMAGTVTTKTGGGPARDRAYAPLFLAVWYLGMTAGFLMGPARTAPPRVRST